MTKLKRIFSLKSLLVIISIGAVGALLLSYLSPLVSPETNRFIPLFGLAYPVSLVVTCILTIVWFFINKRWAISLLVVLLLGIGFFFRMFAFGFGDTPSNASEIRVLSYNVHLFDRYNENRIEALSTKDNILAYLEEVNADVMCFQEFYHRDEPSEYVMQDTIATLLDISDYHARYTHVANKRRNFGISLFSKYPIQHKGEVVFPGNSISYNYCIYADVKTPKGIIRFYNVHLQSIRLNHKDLNTIEQDPNLPADEQSNWLTIASKISQAYPIRTAQAEHLLKHISESPYPVVVCGDFNDTPMSYTYSLFNNNLTDAFRNASWGIGKTYAGALPAGRIDYIFHTPTLGSHDFKIQSEKLSDHYAISCSIFIKSEE